MHRRLAVAAFAILAAGATSLYAQQTSAQQAPALKRTVLQTQHLSVPGYDGVTALAELPPGGVAARHTHAGEELGYVIEGTGILELQGQPPRALKAGDVFFIPAGTPHIARNNGTTTLKILGTYFIESGKPLATPAP
jgi:quercetin dioxygenase-like cupin family protein